MLGVLAIQAEALEQREAWLVGPMLWQEHIDAMPVREIAEFMAGQRDYSDARLVEDEEGWGPEIRNDVWDRAVVEGEQRQARRGNSGSRPAMTQRCGDGQSMFGSSKSRVS